MLVVVNICRLGAFLQIVNEVLPALKDLKESSVLRFVEISGLPLKAFHDVLDRISPGDIDVILSYNNNTLFDDSLLKDPPYFKVQQVFCKRMLDP